MTTYIIFADIFHIAIVAFSERAWTMSTRCWHLRPLQSKWELSANIKELCIKVFCMCTFRKSKDNFFCRFQVSRCFLLLPQRKRVQRSGRKVQGGDTLKRRNHGLWFITMHTKTGSGSKKGKCTKGLASFTQLVKVRGGNLVLALPSIRFS